MPNLRLFVSTSLVFLLALAIPALVTAIWVEIFLRDSNAFADVADEMLDQPDVRLVVRNEVADEVEAKFPQVVVPGMRGIVEAAVEGTMDTALFREVFRQSVSSAHRQLEDGENEVTLRIENVLPVVADQLPDRFPSLAELVANRDSPIVITLASREQQPALWSAFQGVRAGSGAVIAAFAIISGIAFALSPARPHTLALLGLMGTVSCVVVFIMAPLASRPFAVGDPEISRAAAAAWGIVAASLQRIAVVLGAAFLACCLFGVVWDGATHLHDSTGRSRASSRR